MSAPRTRKSGFLVRISTICCDSCSHRYGSNKILDKPASLISVMDWKVIVWNILQISLHTCIHLSLNKNCLICRRKCVNSVSRVNNRIKSYMLFHHDSKCMIDRKTKGFLWTSEKHLSQKILNSHMVSGTSIKQ